MRHLLGAVGLACACACVAGGCGFSPANTSAPGVDGNAPDSISYTTLVDGSAGDFMKGTLTDGVIASRGAVEPAAYAPGGLHARAFATTTIAPTETWAQFETAIGSATQYGERYGTSVIYTNGDRPYGLGITATHIGTYTLELTGEIYLASGPTTFDLDADGTTFVEIDDGEATPPIGRSASSQVGTMTVTPAGGAGWYPIEVAYTHVSGNNSLWALDYAPIAPATAATPIPVGKLRAEVSTVSGLSLTGSPYWDLDLPFSSTIDHAPFTHAFGSAVPAIGDLYYAGSAPPYSLRYAGQLLIDSDGTYQLAVDTGSADLADGYRASIDGALVGLHWPSAPDVAPAAIQLSAGWHSIVIDYSKDNGTGAGATSTFDVTLAVDGGAATAIGSDHLRPAIPFGWLSAAYAGSAVVDVPPAGSDAKTMFPCPLDGAQLLEPNTDGLVDNLDWLAAAAQANPFTGSPAGLAVTIQQPAGSDQFRFPSPSTHPGINYVANRTAFDGKPVTNMWTFTIDNTDPTDHSMGVENLGLILSWHGGSAVGSNVGIVPFATDTMFESQAWPTPGATALGPVHVTADLRGSTIKLQLRTGADDVGLAAAAWVDVTDGAVPALQPGNLIQYRLLFMTDGWNTPSVSRVELSYVAPAT